MPSQNWNGMCNSCPVLLSKFSPLRSVHPKRVLPWQAWYLTGAWTEGIRSRGSAEYVEGVCAAHGSDKLGYRTRQGKCSDPCTGRSNEVVLVFFTTFPCERLARVKGQ